MLLILINLPLISNELFFIPWLYDILIGVWLGEKTGEEEDGRQR